MASGIEEDSFLKYNEILDVNLDGIPQFNEHVLFGDDEFNVVCDQIL